VASLWIWRCRKAASSLRDSHTPFLQCACSESIMQRSIHYETCLRETCMYLTRVRYIERMERFNEMKMPWEISVPPLLLHTLLYGRHDFIKDRVSVVLCDLCEEKQTAQLNFFTFSEEDEQLWKGLNCVLNIHCREFPAQVSIILPSCLWLRLFKHNFIEL